MDEPIVQSPRGPAARVRMIFLLEKVAVDMDKLILSMQTLEDFLTASRQAGHFYAAGPALDVTLPARVKWVREVLDRLKRSRVEGA